MQERGVNVADYGSDAEFADELLGFILANASEDRVREAEIGRQMAPYVHLIPDFMKWREAQEGAEQPGAPATGEGDGKPTWSPPEIDQSLLSYCRRTADGIYEPVPGAPYMPGAAETLNKQTRDYDRWLKEQIGNLPGVIEGIVGPLLEKTKGEYETRLKAAEERLTQFEARDEANALLDQFAQDWYERGPNGQYLIDPTSGHYALTDVGKSAMGLIEKFKERGLSEKDAYALAGEALAMSRPPSGQPAAEAQSQHPRDRFLDQVPRYEPGPSGGPTPPEPTAPAASGPITDPASAFMQQVEAEAKQAGHQPP